jgi:hypothetical protein
MGELPAAEVEGFLLKALEPRPDRLTAAPAIAARAVDPASLRGERRPVGGRQRRSPITGYRRVAKGVSCRPGLASACS